MVESGTTLSSSCASQGSRLGRRVARLREILIQTVLVNVFLNREWHLVADRPPGLNTLADVC
ncbi:MAG: hypothetical protein KatS3mg059_0784 [Thermomicrobiales bacterium]|nr:MAG: hypothetical protein KatS3mg059_0784 [Thermomicrobiales bacterium]